jgi:peptide deformylase
LAIQVKFLGDKVMIKPICRSEKELRRPSLPILPTEDYSAILQDLKDTLATTTGYALSAIQIGIPKKLAYIKPRENRPEIILINAEVVEKKEKFVFPESCLSFPGITIYTDRYALITVNNNGRTEFYSDLDAIIVQHEIQHCRGGLFMDVKHRAW